MRERLVAAPLRGQTLGDSEGAFVLEAITHRRLIEECLTLAPPDPKRLREPGDVEGQISTGR